MEMTPANVMGMVAFAKMLKIPAVENWGANLIADSVTLENLATTWDFAKSLNIGFLMDACINLMETQFIRLISDDLFVRLPGDTVLSLVRSEDLSVDSEEQVFEAISRWVCPGGVVDDERLRTYAPKMLKEVQWHKTTAQFREHLLDNHQIYQTNVECARLMAAVEQWIGAAATRRRMCPFNQHSRNGRTTQMIFVFGRDKDQDRWSVRRFDSELQNEERVADMELRRYATYSVVGESIFVVGGQTSQQNYSTSVDEFLVRERQWRKRASLTVGRKEHAASVVNVGVEDRGCEERTLIGVFGGYYMEGVIVTRLSSCEVYDVSQDRWYRLPDLREKRNGPAAVCLPRDNRVFVFGGKNDSAWTASVEFCQLRADWQGKATSSSTDEFWLPAAPMRTARAFFSATHFRGRILAAGGFDGNTKVNVVEMFSPPDTRCPLGQWTDLAAMKQPRSYFTLLTTRDAVFALGGNDGRSENTVEALTAPEASDDHGNDLTSWIWSTKSPLETLAEIRGADLAVETIELLLREKYDETENRLGHAQIIQLLKFCHKTYFTFDGTIYEQVKGTPMGSPISGLIAEAVLKTAGVAGFPTPQTEILGSRHTLPLHVRNRWYRLPDLREKRNGPAAVCLPHDNRVFVIGGKNDSAWTASVEFCQLRADWQRQATSSSTDEFWLPAAPMRTARAGLSATHFRGRIIAAGGYDGNKKVNVVEMFSPPDTRYPLGQWTDIAAMNQPRTFFTLLTTRDTVFALVLCVARADGPLVVLSVTESNLNIRWLTVWGCHLALNSYFLTIINPTSLNLSTCDKNRGSKCCQLPIQLRPLSQSPSSTQVIPLHATVDVADPHLLHHPYLILSDEDYYQHSKSHHLAFVALPPS
nr:unnamed protein product [Spirometra erinaceieuropaei]